MIHDLLCALLGFTGDTVRWDDGLVLAKSVRNRLETWDIAIIAEILLVATLYTKVRNWTAQRRELLYEQAAAVSIGRHLLGEFEEWVGMYEKKLIDEFKHLSQGVSLSALRLALKQNAWGDKLRIVWQTVDGDGESIFDRIFWGAEKNDHLIFLRNSLCEVLMRQLISWCKYGVGVDVWPVSVVENSLRAKISFAGTAAIILRQKGIKEVPQGLSRNWQYLAEDIEEVRALQSKRLGNILRQDLNKELNVVRGMFLLGFGHAWTEYMQHHDHDCFPKGGNWMLSPQGKEIPKIEYIGVWPISDLIITNHQVEKYGEIFNFLFRLKRIIAKLFSKTTVHPLSYRLGHFFQSLFGFLQIDLIETEWDVFMKTVQESNDVQLVAHAHAVLVTKIHTGCLLSAPDVTSAVLHLEKIAFTVSANSSQLGANDQLDQEIAKQIRSLFRLFEELQLSSTYASLNRLISKLDYNSFYRDRFRQNT